MLLLVVALLFKVNFKMSWFQTISLMIKTSFYVMFLLVRVYIFFLNQVVFSLLGALFLPKIRMKKHIHTPREKGREKKMFVAIIVIGEQLKIPKITSLAICIANNVRIPTSCISFRLCIALYSNWITRWKSLHFSY